MNNVTRIIPIQMEKGRLEGEITAYDKEKADLAAEIKDIENGVGLFADLGTRGAENEDLVEKRRLVDIRTTRIINCNTLINNCYTLIHDCNVAINPPGVRSGNIL